MLERPRARWLPDAIGRNTLYGRVIRSGNLSKLTEAGREATALLSTYREWPQLLVCSVLFRVLVSELARRRTPPVLIRRVVFFDLVLSAPVCVLY